jgi:hypothetical protein
MQGALSLRHLSIPIATVAVALVATVPSLAATKSPCKLMTASDAAKVLGGAPAGPGTAHKVSGIPTCEYTTGSKAVTIDVMGVVVRMVFDTEGKAAPKPVAHLNGVGSDAYSVDGGQDLMAWKNSVELYFVTAGLKQPLPGLKVAAKAAIGRL